MIYVQISRHYRTLRSSQNREVLRSAIKKRCLQQIAALLELNVGDLTIEYKNNGKPILRYFDEYFYFSISYSESFYAFAFSACFSLGIDIEASDVQKSLCFYSNIMASSFSAREKECFKEGFDINKFWLAWTIKEAYSKYTGLGLLEDFTRIEFLDNVVHIETSRRTMGVISCVIFKSVFLTLFFDSTNNEDDGVELLSSFPFIFIDCADRGYIPHRWTVC